MLVSSHLMTEMAMTADRLIVVGQGRLIAQGTVDEVVQIQLDRLRPSRRPPTPKHCDGSLRTPVPASTPNPTARSS